MASEQFPVCFPWNPRNWRLFTSRYRFAFIIFIIRGLPRSRREANSEFIASLRGAPRDTVVELIGRCEQRVIRVSDTRQSWALRQRALTPTVGSCRAAMCKLARTLSNVRAGDATLEREQTCSNIRRRSNGCVSARVSVFASWLAQ